MVNFPRLSSIAQATMPPGKDFYGLDQILGLSSPSAMPVVAKAKPLSPPAPPQVTTQQAAATLSAPTPTASDIFGKRPRTETFNINGLAFTSVEEKIATWEQIPKTPPSSLTQSTPVSWEQISSSSGDAEHPIVEAEKEIDLTAFDPPTESETFWTQDDIGGAEGHEYEEGTEHDSDVGGSGPKKEEEYWEPEDHEEFDDDDRSRGLRQSPRRRFRG